MMKRTRIVGLCLVAVFALSAVAAASASAHEFVASKEGTVLDHGLNTHKFKTSVGTVECKKVSSEGKAKSGKQETLTEKVTYSECELTEPFKGSATVSVAEYQFNANETVSVLNTITVKTSLCTITVGPQSKLSSVKYKNLTGGKVEVNAGVKAIEYKTSGLCGSKTEKTGEYTGLAEAELSGGTLEWK